MFTAAGCLNGLQLHSCKVAQNDEHYKLIDAVSFIIVFFWSGVAWHNPNIDQFIPNMATRVLNVELFSN